MTNYDKVLFQPLADQPEVDCFGGFHTLDFILVANMPLTVDVVAAWMSVVRDCHDCLKRDLERGESADIHLVIDISEDHISRAHPEVVEAARVWRVLQ